MNNKNGRNKQRVRFAPTCQVIVVVDKTKGIEDNKLWYSSEDVDQFKLYWTFYCDAIRESIRQGTFDGELDDILGLERPLFDKIYLARRAAFKGAVLEEQTWQILSREMRRRRGLTCEVNGHTADMDILTLANAAAMSSSWAKERAYIAGLTLQSNLYTFTGSISIGGAEISRNPPSRGVDQDDSDSYWDECHAIAMEEEEGDV
jgi:hypothetical protein